MTIIDNSRLSTDDDGGVGGAGVSHTPPCLQLIVTVNIKIKHNCSSWDLCLID